MSKINISSLQEISSYLQIYLPIFIDGILTLFQIWALRA